MNEEYERLWVVIRKAVDLGLLPKYDNQEGYLAGVEKIRALMAVIQPATFTPCQELRAAATTLMIMIDMWEGVPIGVHAANEVVRKALAKQPDPAA